MSMPTNPLFATFIAMLIDTLIAMVPGSDDDTKETRRGIARLMFEAYQPHDAIEAMAAARAVAAHHAAMDNFRRAAQPGVSDAVVVRLRSGALAAGRSVEAVLRARDRRRQQQTPDRGEGAGAAACRQSRDATPARHTAGAGGALVAAGLSSQHRAFRDAAAGTARGIVAVTALPAATFTGGLQHSRARLSASARRDRAPSRKRHPFRCPLPHIAAGTWSCNASAPSERLLSAGKVCYW